MLILFNEQIFVMLCEILLKGKVKVGVEAERGRERERERGERERGREAREREREILLRYYQHHTLSFTKEEEHTL